MLYLVLVVLSILSIWKLGNGHKINFITSDFIFILLPRSKGQKLENIFSDRIVNI